MKFIKIEYRHTHTYTHNFYQAVITIFTFQTALLVSPNDINQHVNLMLIPWSIMFYSFVCDNLVNIFRFYTHIRAINIR